MKRTEPRLLNDIIKECLKANGMETRHNEQRAAYLWPEVVDPGINRYTTRRYVCAGIMHVYISSASLKSELSFHKERLIAAINRAVGSPVITSIQFH